MWLLVLNVRFVWDSEVRFCIRAVFLYNIIIFNITEEWNDNFSYTKEIQFFLAFKCVNFVLDKYYFKIEHIDTFHHLSVLGNCVLCGIERKAEFLVIIIIVFLFLLLAVDV